MSKSIILNLGCGAKTSPSCVNIDWSPHLRIARNPFLYGIARRVLSPQRQRYLEQLRHSIMVHDLTKGIPFADSSVDAVYHAHTLEHIDRHIYRDRQNLDDDPAVKFTVECRRVLKSGGVLRIVVPDFEELCRLYLAHIDKCLIEPVETGEHDQAIYDMIGQSVMKEAPGTSQQSPILRHLENFFLGDARRRGQTHQWAYDRINITELLRHAGFDDIHLLTYDASRIPNWNEFGLDRKNNGAEYRPGSLYVEAVK